MKKENKLRSVTIRIEPELYQQLVDKAISQSVSENRIIKVSELIRTTLKNSLDGN